MIKKFLSGIAVGLVVLGVILLLWQGSFSLSFGKEKTISVTGTGKVKMKPEVARFTAGVQKYGSTVDEAADQKKQFFFCPYKTESGCIWWFLKESW